MSSCRIVQHHGVGELPQPEYDRWVASRTDSLIYATPMFHRFLARAAGGECHYLLARRGGELVGALPFFRRDVEGLGSLLNSLPWYGTHGACVGIGRDDHASRKALLAAFATYARELQPLSSTLVLTPEESACVDDYLGIFEHVVTDTRIGQWTPLPAGGDQAALARTVLQKTRNLVNKSLRQGFQEEVGDESDEAWQFLSDVHAENLQAIGGKAKPRAHFEALRAEIPRPHRRLTVAWLGDQPVAALLLLAYNRTVEYLTPVIRAEYRSCQPLSFLIWQGMTWAMMQGLIWWNWGGTWSTQTSLRHFKAGWGAVDRPYTYVIGSTLSAVARLRADIGKIAAAFPYYYVYPHSQL